MWRVKDNMPECVIREWKGSEVDEQIRPDFQTPSVAQHVCFLTDIPEKCPRVGLVEPHHPRSARRIKNRVLGRHRYSLLQTVPELFARLHFLRVPPLPTAPLRGRSLSSAWERLNVHVRFAEQVSAGIL